MRTILHTEHMTGSIMLRTHIAFFQGPKPAETDARTLMERVVTSPNLATMHREANRLGLTHVPGNPIPEGMEPSSVEWNYWFDLPPEWAADLFFRRIESRNNRAYMVLKSVLLAVDRLGTALHDPATAALDRAIWTIENHPEGRPLTDKNREWMSGIRGSLIENVAGEFEKMARVGIEAGTIVFMHTILESAVQDLCKVSMMKSPAGWERVISDWTFPWDEIKRTPAEELCQQALQKYLAQQFVKKSLPNRINVLLSMCPPPPLPITNSYKWLAEFRYEHERVVAFDKVRHRLVHEDALGSTENFRESVSFIQGCVLYLETLVAERYGIRTIAQMNAAALAALPEGGPPLP